MKTLQQLREKANMGIAQDYVAPKDEDDEATKAKYRAKGEQDFADSHKVIKTKHPVADDDQFDGNTKFDCTFTAFWNSFWLDQKILF